MKASNIVNAILIPESLINGKLLKPQQQTASNTDGGIIFGRGLVWKLVRYCFQDSVYLFETEKFYIIFYIDLRWFTFQLIVKIFLEIPIFEA